MRRRSEWESLLPFERAACGSPSRNDHATRRLEVDELSSMRREGGRNGNHASLKEGGIQLFRTSKLRAFKLDSNERRYPVQMKTHASAPKCGMPYLSQSGQKKREIKTPASFAASVFVQPPTAAAPKSRRRPGYVQGDTKELMKLVWLPCARSRNA